MSVYIILSQMSRLGAVWVKSKQTKNILLSASILFYTAILIKRENKFKEKYEPRVKRNQRPSNSSEENS